MHSALKNIQVKIEMIEDIVSEKGSIITSLEDEKHSKPAILMHLIAIAEQFQRLQDAMEFEILSKFDKEDIRGAFAVRNFIAHDYEGVDLYIVEDVINKRLPIIKSATQKILNLKK